MSIPVDDILKDVIAWGTPDQVTDARILLEACPSPAPTVYCREDLPIVYMTWKLPPEVEFTVRLDRRGRRSLELNGQGAFQASLILLAAVGGYQKTQ